MLATFFRPPFLATSSVFAHLLTHARSVRAVATALLIKRGSLTSTLENATKFGLSVRPCTEAARPPMNSHSSSEAEQAQPEYLCLRECSCPYSFIATCGTHPYPTPLRERGFWTLHTRARAAAGERRGGQPIMPVWVI